VREIAQPAIPFAKQEFLVEKLSMRERERGFTYPNKKQVNGFYFTIFSKKMSLASLEIKNGSLTRRT